MSRFRKSFCLATACVGAWAVAYAQPYELHVEIDRDPAVYAAGETAKVFVRITQDGKAVGGKTARCSWNYGNSNTVTIAESGTTLELTLDRPGQVMLRGDLYDGTNCLMGVDRKGRPAALIIWAGAVFSPERLSIERKRPDDFDAYWDGEVAEMKRRVPLEPSLVRREKAPAAKGFVAWNVEIPCCPRPACAYLSMPEGAKKGALPAVVMFQGYGASQSVHEFVTNGLFVCVNPHGFGNARPAADWSRFLANEGNRYEYRGWESRDSCFFHGQSLRAVRALEWVKTLPEWDGRNLAVKGVSMGGSQSLQAAALDKDVTLCVPRDPAMCDHAGILSDPPHRSGWPWILANPRNLPAVLGYGPVDPVTLAVSDYYDNVFFAERITCPVYMSTGFSDDVCFSEGVYKAYNALKGPKQIETNPYNGHCATYNRAGERKLLNQER